MDREFARHGLKYDCAAYSAGYKSSSSSLYEVPFSTWFLHSLRLMSNKFYIEERTGDSVELYVTKISHQPDYSDYNDSSMMADLNSWNNAKALTSFQSMNEWQNAKGVDDAEQALVPRTSATQWLGESLDPLRSGQKSDPTLEGASVFRFAAMEPVGVGIGELVEYSPAGSSPVIVEEVVEETAAEEEEGGGGGGTESFQQESTVYEASQDDLVAILEALGNNNAPVTAAEEGEKPAVTEQDTPTIGSVLSTVLL